MDKKKYYISIPKVDNLLNNEKIIELIKKTNRELVVDIIRKQIDEVREYINMSQSEQSIEKKLEKIIEDIENSLNKLISSKYKKVVNGTGVVIHTNLGRSVISKKVSDKVSLIIQGYSNLEYNLETGKRGSRYSHFEELISKITGAESALVVNNNAGAVLLILNTLAKDKEVIVSRGELVEIGGAFRVPDVMTQSGAKLIEVGTTNKTHKEDYENAVNEETAALLKVHTSNYRIIGFTENVSIDEVTKIGRKHDIPVVEDLGSGVLIDLSKYGLAHEPTVQDSIKQGADIVCFSGDKLLGGPQAGIIIGKKRYIDKMKKNPLTRAVRIDKFTAAALESVLLEYLDEEKAVKNIPTLKMITQPISEIEKKADELVKKLNVISNEFEIFIDDCYSQVGGGSLPLERISSKGVVIKYKNISTASLERQLRQCRIPIITRIVNDNVLIDLRTVDENEIDLICESLKEVLKK